MLSTLKRSLKPLLLKTYNNRNNKFSKNFINSNRASIVERNNLVTSLPGEKILVLAPHVDDDMIGCGGAILKYLKEGKEVHIAYLTTGQKNGRSGLNEKQIVEERKKEAFLVADCIGIPESNLHFFNSRDSELLYTDITCELNNILQDYQIDTIFFPSILDTHIDHYATSKKLLAVFNKSQVTVQNMTLMMYEVQSPISPLFSNTVLDITNEFKLKSKLLKYYRSQQTNFHFLPIMNRLNGLVINENRMAEVFIKTNFKSYMKFIEENFNSDDNYVNLKENLIAHRDHRNTIDTYNNVQKFKCDLLQL